MHKLPPKKQPCASSRTRCRAASRWPHSNKPKRKPQQHGPNRESHHLPQERSRSSKSPKGQFQRPLYPARLRPLHDPQRWFQKRPHQARTSPNSRHLHRSDRRLHRRQNRRAVCRRRPFANPLRRPRIPYASATSNYVASNRFRNCPKKLNARSYAPPSSKTWCPVKPVRRLARYSSSAEKLRFAP